MALRSMTGFASSRGSFEAYHWVWELKTVNGRGLDVRLRLPHGNEALEQPLRKQVAARLQRGSCYISLNLKRSGEQSEVRVNEAALATVLKLAEEIGGRLDIDKPSVDGLLALRGVMENVEPEDSDEMRANLNRALQDDLEAALDALCVMREEEGARLQAMLEGHLDAIEALTREAEASPARTIEAIQARLKEQVQTLLDSQLGLDMQRLHQEAVLLATKADIREEIDRLYAHVAAARDLLQSDVAVGRKLDFLTQEFNREANTLCSKSNDTSITDIGLQLKVHIDQLREQVQNIE